MRIDTHQHFIAYSPADPEYAWITDEMKPLQQRLMPEQLKPLLDSAGFDGTVVVQARQTLNETKWLLDLSDRFDWIRGVVGWVDLCSAEVDRQLETFASHPKFKGVRHIVQGEPDDRFMLRDDFQRGLEKLFSFGLTYDLLLYPKHLPYAVELVRNFPDRPFVLDHIAKPDIKNRVMQPWKDDFCRLADFSNVYCKLSGMVTEADWNSWKPEHIEPYLQVAMDAFGPDRLMIGSDWPVCTLCGDYADVMDVVRSFLDRYPEEVRENILGKNGVRFYNCKVG